MSSTGSRTTRLASAITRSDAEDQVVVLEMSALVSGLQFQTRKKLDVCWILTCVLIFLIFMQWSTVWWCCVHADCNARVAADQQAELIWERRGRDIETLELFPLSSFKLQEGEAWMTTAVRNEWREVSLFDPENDPPLDLRLSFL